MLSFTLSWVPDNANIIKNVIYGAIVKKNYNLPLLQFEKYT